MADRNQRGDSQYFCNVSTVSAVADSWLKPSLRTGIGGLEARDWRLLWHYSDGFVDLVFLNGRYNGRGILELAGVTAVLLSAVR